MSQGTDEGGSGHSNPWPQAWYQWPQQQEQHELSSLSLSLAMVRSWWSLTAFSRQ